MTTHKESEKPQQEKKQSIFNKIKNSFSEPNEKVLQKTIGYIFLLGGLIALADAFGMFKSYISGKSEYEDYILVGLLTIAGAYMVKK